jgi:hypothetical protein
MHVGHLNTIFQRAHCHPRCKRVSAWCCHCCVAYTKGDASASIGYTGGRRATQLGRVRRRRLAVHVVEHRHVEPAPSTSALADSTNTLSQSADDDRLNRSHTGPKPPIALGCGRRSNNASTTCQRALPVFHGQWGRPSSSRSPFPRRPRRFGSDLVPPALHANALPALCCACTVSGVPRAALAAFMSNSSTSGLRLGSLTAATISRHWSSLISFLFTQTTSSCFRLRWSCESVGNLHRRSWKPRCKPPRPSTSCGWKSRSVRRSSLRNLAERVRHMDTPSTTTQAAMVESRFQNRSYASQTLACRCPSP